MSTKDKVLKMLLDARPGYISGQEMAEKVFVTRAGIWKAIKQLEKEGYEIEAVTNRGYRLHTDTDIISAEKIEKELRARGLDIKVFYYEEVGSTNDKVNELGMTNEGDLLCIAGKQTNGRGRRGRNFYSPKDTGLYMSLLFRNPESNEKLAGLTATAAVAVSETIDEVVYEGRDKTKIKWVNDIFVNDRKVSGILCEGHGNFETGETYIIVGIGINVFAPREEIPKEIKTIAGSLEGSESKMDEDVRNKLAIGTFWRLADYGNKKEDTLSVYRRKSNLIGNYVKINSFSEKQGEKYAKVTGIDDDFHLLVEYDDGRVEALSSGEVSVVKY